MTIHSCGGWAVGETLPLVLTVDQLATVLGFTRRAVQERRAELAWLEVDPTLRGARRYSGKKVQAWLNGEAQVPKFFGSARRAAGR